MIWSYRNARRAAGPLVGAAITLVLSGCANHHPGRVSSTRAWTPNQPACPPVKPGNDPVEGCWNAANLASMVADPRDLVRGKPLGAADGAHASLVVEAYQKNAAASTGASAGGSTTSGASGSSGSGPQ